jgi:distribution and morphology protein 34
MAFNFNWSPLTADAGFYTKAQELLTAALNKSQKPPIIVDDIIVNELNLGHVPPDLEILEIGDLAEDRFRGIFKMSYNGDAFLTLKTRVQANPLNTYLSTRPSFASPQPLAAATGLTIPLSITLSDIKLSAFIILVFSRQKGLTLVFRNDPLESLKVSSTFDSIPFVANYLQKEIEGQLRVLLMDELPAIIHRLSLRMFVPEHSVPDEVDMNASDATQEEQVVDPFASPPQDPVDSTGNPLSAAQIASLSLDSGVETQSLFSQKNLIRLATLTDSHRTLSLFTPNIRDVVFRAWAGPMERGEYMGFHTNTANTPALSRTHSYAGSMSTTYTFENASQTRPSLHSFGSSYIGNSRSKGHVGRKRKKRIVNLRKQPETGETDIMIEDGSTITDSASVTDSASSAPSVFSAPGAMGSSQNPITPPISPVINRHGKAADREPISQAVANSANKDNVPISQRRVASYGNDPHRTLRAREVRPDDIDATPRASMYLPEREKSLPAHEPTSSPQLSSRPKLHTEKSDMSTSTSPSSSTAPLPSFFQFIADPTNSSSIAEKAWMMKMANEVAAKYEEERQKGSFGVGGRKEEDAPPPAYAPRGLGL